MELFTLGIGNYTEQDVKESARAFTGWQRTSQAQFTFNPELHDGGRKEFLGRHGRFRGNDIIDILMQQPATPRFIARKLLVFFACPEPPDSVVAEAADLLTRTRLNVEWFLRDLFQSKFFYSAACRRTRISSPAEFVIGICRSLGVRQVECHTVDRPPRGRGPGYASAGSERQTIPPGGDYRCRPKSSRRGRPHPAEGGGRAFRDVNHR